MYSEQLLTSMSDVLSLFAAEHLNYPVKFKQSLNQTMINGISKDILTMTTATGVSLLSFVITRDRKIYNQSFKSITVKLHDVKHLSIYNKFVKECMKHSSDSFSLFMSKLKEKTKRLNFIKSINILPYQDRKALIENDQVKIDFSDHALITTPFEEITVIKTPFFIFENDQFYIHDKFSFLSLGRRYTFSQTTVSNIDFMSEVVKEFNQDFYDSHYDIITSRLVELYGFNLKDLASWTAKQFEEYYPVLSMERY